jgi:hypothetical protein
MHKHDYLNPIGWGFIGSTVAVEWIQHNGLTILSVLGLVIGSACQIIQTRIRIREERSRYILKMPCRNIHRYNGRSDAPEP